MIYTKDLLFLNNTDSHDPNNTSIYEIKCGVSKDNVRCNLTAVELININQSLHGSLQNSLMKQKLLHIFNREQDQSLMAT